MGVSGVGQLVQPGDPGDPLPELGLAQPSSRLVLDLHVVVVLGPAVPTNSIQSSLLDNAILSAARGRTTSGLMVKCSHRHGGHDSHQRSTLPTTGKGTICQ
jgi:hypothetical protein